MGKIKSKISTPKKSKVKTDTPEPQKIPDWTPEAAERIVKNLRTLATGPSGSSALELAKRTDELLGPISGRLWWQGYDDPDHLDIYGRGEAVRRVLGDDELCLLTIIGETQEILTAIQIGVVRDHHADHLHRLADELEAAFKVAEKIDQARRAARYVLDNLGEADRFNIVTFSTATRLFAERPVGLSQAAAGRQFIDRLRAAGSTDINRALLEAVAGVDEERPTVVIFMTDGLPTAGEIDPDRIVANVAAAAPRSVRLFSFGVGYDVDTLLLDELSSQQRGTSAYVRPEQDIEEEVSGFYATVSAPVLVDVQAAFSGVKVEDMYPYPLPDLFGGTQLIIAGRYREGGTATLRLSGEVDAGARTYRYAGLQFVERGGNEFIPRLWAQRKIGYLLTQIRLKGERVELVEEVTELGTKHGIVTPYTSFLVEEPGAAGPIPGHTFGGPGTPVLPGIGGGGAAATRPRSRL